MHRLLQREERERERNSRGIIRIHLSSRSRDRRLESTCHRRVFISFNPLHLYPALYTCVRAYVRSFRADTYLPPPPLSRLSPSPSAFTRALVLVYIYEPLFRAGGVTLRNAQGRRQKGGRGVLIENAECEREKERGAALVLIGPGHAIFTIRRHGHLATGRRSYLATYVLIEL